MLHEILLSLSGHPSPLLKENPQENPQENLPAEKESGSIVTPPERQLLASAAHLSRVHIDLLAHTAQIANSHPSTICRAVATAIQSIHLAAFQRDVLRVEEALLRKDPSLVGEYGVVPLTAVVGEFTQWTRRFDWLWDMTNYMRTDTHDNDDDDDDDDDDNGDHNNGGYQRSGAQMMDRLRDELRSGYRDVEDTAMSLVRVAETAWLKQVSAWVLYGRLPTLGGDDFFVRQSYTYEPRLLPGFVSPHAASSMLFIGKSLNHARVKATAVVGAELPSRLAELASLTFPIHAASFSRAITAIRLSLSQNILQRILPTARVVEILQLLRDFFLLGRGEFAMALTQEADEKIRSRWRRGADMDLGTGSLSLKNGEVSAVLARAWAVLVAMQRHQVDEDEQLELARDLLQLHLSSSSSLLASPISAGYGLTADDARTLNASPFGSLLFSVPAALSIRLPSPLDMVISPSDLQLYSTINSYLLSMRRAHIRLTDLWKISPLRRHHPSPRGASPAAADIRERWSARASSMRSSWTTASAAIFFLGETEAYLQTEIVEPLWDGFYTWMTSRPPLSRPALSRRGTVSSRPDSSDFPTPTTPTPIPIPLHAYRNAPDPQALATAHALYLRTLTHRLLLTQPPFTQLLHSLLLHIDQLVAHVHRLQGIFTSIDIETDAGVLTSFTALEREETEVVASLRAVEGKVRSGIEDSIAALRELESDPHFLARWEGSRSGGDGGGGGGGGGGAVGEEDRDGDWGQGERYVPGRLGGINRLLMKLHFGTWIDTRDDGYV